MCPGAGKDGCHVAEEKERRHAEHADDAEDEDRVTLVDDEGQEHEFTLIDVVEVDKRRYAVLLPEEDPEEGAYVFRLENDADGEEVLVNVEDDDEFDRVVHALEEQEEGDEEDESDDGDAWDEDDDYDEDEEEDEDLDEDDEDEEDEDRRH